MNSLFIILVGATNVPFDSGTKLKQNAQLSIRIRSISVSLLTGGTYVHQRVWKPRETISLELCMAIRPSCSPVFFHSSQLGGSGDVPLEASNGIAFSSP